MAEVKHPTGLVLRVSDESVDKYIRQGFTKVEAPKKRTTKRAEKPSESSSNED